MKGGLVEVERMGFLSVVNWYNRTSGTSRRWVGAGREPGWSFLPLYWQSGSRIQPVRYLIAYPCTAAIPGPLARPAR
jgi:hypothetical protein